MAVSLKTRKLFRVRSRKNTVQDNYATFTVRNFPVPLQRRFDQELARLREQGVRVSRKDFIVRCVVDFLQSRGIPTDRLIPEPEERKDETED
jgi:hypothetical protein